MYYQRIIDKYLEEWMKDEERKPLLLRGARQVGKSTAVRHLAEKFDIFVEINFEKMPEYKAVFEQNLNVERIVSEIGALADKEIIIGKNVYQGLSGVLWKTSAKSSGPTKKTLTSNTT